MKTCVVTATYGCAPNKVWLYMTNPTLNSWNPTVASAEVDLEGMHIVEKNKDGTTTDIHFDKLDKPRRISCTFTRGKIRGAFTAILLGSADSTSLNARWMWKVLVCLPSRRKSWKRIWKPCAKYWVTKPESDSQYLW